MSIDGDLLKVVWETGGPESPFPDANYYLSLSTQSAESLNNADHPPDPEYWLTASVVDGVAAPDGLSVADATSADLPALWTGTAVVSGATVTARMPLSATPGIESAFRWNAGFQALVDANYGESFCPSDGSFLEYPPQ